MKKPLLLLFTLLLSIFVFSQNIAQNPRPSLSQLNALQMEFYLFVHFGPNTFTDMEWGHGNEKPDEFNPEMLDCNQWCAIAKASGAKGIIITAKHHDGFCLWPSKFSTHTVKESKWRNGKGDVLKELSVACKKNGLKFGVYLSPRDRNHPKYGTDEYNEVFVNMIHEIFKNYSPVWEFWFDGANGEGPNGKKQVYDWKKFHSAIRKLSPNTLMFSDVGPDIRWVGNESGIAGKTNWCLLNIDGFEPGAKGPNLDTLTKGNVNGKNFIFAECDVSIRDGWFYHKKEDAGVKSPEKLFDLYLKSVGRGANFLLNVPPNQQGKFSPQDSVALLNFKKLLDKNFKTNLFGNAKVSNKTNVFNYLLINEINTTKPVKFNCVVLQEDINEGQKIAEAEIECYLKHQKVYHTEITTIGNKRILTFPAIEADKIEVRIKSAKGKPIIKPVKIYLIDENLIEK